MLLESHTGRLSAWLLDLRLAAAAGFLQTRRHVFEPTRRRTIDELIANRRTVKHSALDGVVEY